MSEVIETSSDGLIPYNIDSISKNKLYEVKIESIYDPSKFWIIIHFRELALFTDFLTDFYESEHKRLAIPRIKMRKGMTCIVYRDAKYHRGIILPAALPECHKIRVFLVDYGHTVNVQVNNIYYMINKHQLVPRFAIRASLAYLSPTDEFAPWNLNDLKVFCELISGKELFIDILEIDNTLKILHVNVYRMIGNISESVNNYMVNTSLARISQAVPESTDTKSKYKNKLKFMQLFPSFTALEDGIVPCSVWEQNLLRYVPKDVLYPAYFEYNYDHTDGVQDGNDCIISTGVFEDAN